MIERGESQSQKLYEAIGEETIERIAQETIEFLDKNYPDCVDKFIVVSASVGIFSWLYAFARPGEFDLEILMLEIIEAAKRSVKRAETANEN